MKTIIDKNKRKVLGLSRAIARRSALPIPTEKDLQKKDGLYFIGLNIDEKRLKKPLPIGLIKNLKTEMQKIDKLKEAKIKLVKIGKS